MPILKHRLELQGISHVVSLVSFSDVKAFEENNFTGFTPKRRLNHRRVFYGVESVPKIEIFYEGKFFVTYLVNRAKITSRNS